MKPLLFALLFSLNVQGQTDTIPVIAFVSYCDGCAIVAKSGYQINGKLWYRSTAAFNKGKWFPFRENWKVWEVRKVKSK